MEGKRKDKEKNFSVVLVLVMAVFIISLVPSISIADGEVLKARGGIMVRAPSISGLICAEARVTMILEKFRKKIMRFEKENYFIEITYGISSDAGKHNKPVYFVETNLNWDDLPDDLKVQILKDDIEGLGKLKKAVKSWATREELTLVSI